MDNQKPSHLGAPTLVHNVATFAEMMAHLRSQPIIAIDTESDSLYSYYPKVCLIQISTFADPDDTDPRQVLDYLVDRVQHVQDLPPSVCPPAYDPIAPSHATPATPANTHSSW